VKQLAKVKFQTTLNEDLIKTLKKKAIDEGVGANDIIEESLKEKFEREGKSGKEKI